jgi:hypothetical protein
MNVMLQTLQVYDPAMCCNTGVCGPDVDPRLVQFSADLEWIRTQGVIVQRFGLSQQPAAFAGNELVKAALAEKGVDALPLLLINGRIVLSGRYPGPGELAGWLHLKDSARPGAAGGGECCSGGGCC